MRICFADPLKGGHRIHHVVALIRVLARQASVESIFAVHPGVAEGAQKVLAENLLQSSGCVFRPLNENLFRKIRSNNKDAFHGYLGLRILERIAKENRCHHLHLMQLDTFLPGLSLRLLMAGRISYSGLYFRPTMHYNSVFGTNLKNREVLLNRIKSVLLSQILASRRVKVVQSLDNYFPHAFQSSNHGDKLVAIPDLASPPKSSQRPENLPKRWTDRPTRLLLFGAISSRKGVFVLLDALNSLPEHVVNHISILLAGRVNDNERERIKNNMGALAVNRPNIAVDMIDRYLSDQELWWLVQKTSMVIMPYQRHIGSSGVLCWAAAAGKPVLSQSFGFIGQEIEQNKLGIAVDTEDPDVLAVAIANFAKGGFDGEEQTQKRKEYAFRHTEEAFGKATIESIIQALTST